MRSVDHNPCRIGADASRPSLILYLHGYGSSGLSTKARHYQQRWGKQKVLAPSLPKDSRLAADSLEQLISALQPCYNLGLIGSSLGGYLAIYFAEKYTLPAVVINPAIPPWAQTEAVQPPLSTQADTPFIWLPEHFKRLAAYRVTTVSEALASRLLVLQQLDDEVLDARLALDYLAQAQILSSQGGGHRFSNIAEFDQQVLRFFQRFLPDMLK